MIQTEKQKELDLLQEQFDSLLKVHNLPILSPNDIIGTHIKDLKAYNELRDAGLRMVQMVADDKKISLKEVVDEIGYSIKDD
ncbi:hypothetical protein RI543_000861 [Arxiozyma heterogenica]|uniref:Uncharacterized protein n=1 Tax=Arxiozyma heterogenica TaxID=278026 RepID=A0AAN7WNW6_9SACH|nr:hypothetical protein RI543_000861 [Kazachstania heterogenica]